jgi:8-oxo-dGTP diphosphatase
MRQHLEGTGEAGLLTAGSERRHQNPTVRVDHVAASPAVDLRLVLFTVAAGKLWTALRADGSELRLPGGTPTPERPLDADARRFARDTTDSREQYLEQLYTLSVAEDATWTVIVGYLGLIGSAADGPSPIAGVWHRVGELPALARADRMMVDYALLRLRAKLGYTSIAFHLLPPTFSMGELQGVYEAVLGRQLDKRNFRRRVIAAGFLEPTGDERRDGSHRPARLYRFPATVDRDTYLTPPWAESA